jgi:hypothetical protein
MRRPLAVGVALAAAASVGAGCRSTGHGVASRSSLSTEAAAPGGAPPGGAHAVGDTVTLGGGSVAVVALEENVDAGRLFAPPHGSRYVAAEVRGCAGPKETGVAFHPQYFALRLTDRTEHDGDRGVKKPALDPGTIAPGGCSDGWVTFVVPARATAIAVVYHGSDDVTWTMSTSPPATR